MNVISYTNAGKRRYGENHWFWAVWIDVDDPHYQWNDTDPSKSGFCSSKKEARTAVWSAIASLVPDNQNAYRRGWSYSYLSEQQSKDQRPSFSRCKIGKSKWFWIVYDDFLCNCEPLAVGTADSPETAQREAENAVGTVFHSGNGSAEYYRTKKAAIKRGQKTSSNSSTSPLEFVYECHPYHGDFDISDSITKHRIVKKTKKRLYVEKEHYRENMKCSGDWNDYVQPTFILDRKVFEETGKAKRASRWHNAYYSDPAIYYAERQSMAHRPDCYISLGIPAGASIKEVKSAYKKLVRVTHPDAGGDAEEFKKVCDWYDQAMLLVT